MTLSYHASKRWLERGQLRSVLHANGAQMSYEIYNPRFCRVIRFVMVFVSMLTVIVGYFTQSCCDFMKNRIPAWVITQNWFLFFKLRYLYTPNYITLNRVIKFFILLPILRTIMVYVPYPYFRWIENRVSGWGTTKISFLPINYDISVHLNTVLKTWLNYPRIG